MKIRVQEYELLDALSISQFIYLRVEMRHLSLFIAALCYLVFSTGILVSVHTCGGEIVDFEFYAAEAESCAGSSCETDGCCENHVHFYKVKEEAKLISALKLATLQAVLIPTSKIFDIPQTIGNIQEAPQTLPIRPPPLIRLKTPIFILNRVLRL